jgi:histone deacetylase 11
MKSYVVYSSGYDFGFELLNYFHPFHGKKFSEAWKLFSKEHLNDLESFWIEPKQLISDAQLLKIHDQTYLDSLNQSSTIAKIIEIKIAQWVPNKLLQNHLMEPIRLACNGTILAADTALQNEAIAMNFGGGYHHAHADHGEGFCFFSDAALSILECRETELLGAKDKVLMIDLDAHRGNGFEAVTCDDENVFIFDMYNFQIYPGLHSGEPDDYPYIIPLKYGMNGERYLNMLENELTSFLQEQNDASLIFYNAGNDILAGDPLGGLNIAYEDVILRDKFVIDHLKRLSIPTVIMTSGGYTKRSHELIAEMATYIMSQ